MKISIGNVRTTVLLVAAMLTLTACNEDKVPPANGDTMGVSSQQSGYKTTPGEAGGVEENSFSLTVTVASVDKATRQLTLMDEHGNKATFVAGPEIKNFDQIRSGDHLKATFNEKMKIFVRDNDEEPSVSHAAALATAPKGAKPGAMVGQMYEIVAKVKSIDTEKRMATLQFSDGSTRDVHVRKDVDLSKYEAGNSVVIQVSESLSVAVVTP